MTVPNLIGRDVRISLADFAGNFVELEPWQEQLLGDLDALGAQIVPMRPDAVGPDSATVTICLGKSAQITVDDLYDIPSRKLEELTRMEPKHITAARDEAAAAKPIAPRNRKERRAEKAKARRRGL